MESREWRSSRYTIFVQTKGARRRGEVSMDRGASGPNARDGETRS